MQTWPQYSATNQYYLAMNSRIDLPGFPSNYNLEKNSLWSDVVPDFAPGRPIRIRDIVVT